MAKFVTRFQALILTCALALTLSGGVTSNAMAGLLDDAKKMINNLPQATSGSNSQSLTGILGNDEIIEGLKEALRVGSEKVVAQVGKTDGYLNDQDIHIPLPDNMSIVHDALNKIGFGHLTADLETRLNRAAEKAAPEAKDVFWQSISEMTLDDAKKILDGHDTAATDYFRRHMTPLLVERFTPIINASLAEVGAVQAYDQVMGRYGALPFVPDVKADLTAYAVEKALEGLFYYIAREEAAIRSDPAARTTDILKKVFAS